MKKMFTLICLAAVALMGVTPAQAQERKLTADEAAVVVKQVVPAMFDQVKQFTGIDFLAATRADFGIESFVDSRLFNVNGVGLRAENVNEPLRIKPDSMRLDLTVMDIEGIPEMIKPLLKDVRFRFNNWAVLSFGIEGQEIELYIPGTISVDLMPGIEGGINDAVTLEFKTEAGTGFLPFQKLTAELKLEPFIATMLQMIGLDFTGGKLITFTETPVSETQLDYNLVLEPAMRALLGLLEVSDIFDLKLELDLSGMAQMQVKGNLYAVIPQLELEVILMDCLLQLGSKNHSLLCTLYYEGMAAEQRKYTLSDSYEPLMDRSALILTDSTKLVNDEEWSWQASHYMTFSVPNSMKSFNMTANDLMQEMMVDVISGMYDDYYEVNFYQLVKLPIDGAPEGDPSTADLIVPTMRLLGAIELEYSHDGNNTKPQFKISVSMQQIADMTVYPAEWTEVTALQALIPSTGPVEMEIFISKDGQLVSLGKSFIDSNAMGVITDTEAIDTLQHRVTVQQDGIVIEGIDQALYSIIDLSGKTVTKGRINSVGAYIPTSHLAKGFYILHLDMNGQGEAVKFLK